MRVTAGEEEEEERETAAGLRAERRTAERGIERRGRDLVAWRSPRLTADMMMPRTLVPAFLGINWIRTNEIPDAGCNLGWDLSGIWGREGATCFLSGPLQRSLFAATCRSFPTSDRDPCRQSPEEAISVGCIQEVHTYGNINSQDRNGHLGRRRYQLTCFHFLYFRFSVVNTSFSFFLLVIIELPRFGLELLPVEGLVQRLECQGQASSM
jgi:hypothetical protein